MDRVHRHPADRIDVQSIRGGLSPRHRFIELHRLRHISQLAPATRKQLDRIQPAGRLPGRLGQQRLSARGSARYPRSDVDGRN